MAVSFYNGYIADTPATATDPVRVSVPNLTIQDRIVYGPLPWKPNIDENGVSRGPSRGDKALIAIDDANPGEQWIVRWTGSRIIRPNTSDVTGVDMSGIGIAGSKRAGRKLTLADFTTLLGISAPVALYNFDNGTVDSSGNGLNLTNTTAAVTYGPDVNGIANASARFNGNVNQALFIADASGGPFNIRTGSFGCWFKTAKTGVSQRLLAKGTNVNGARSWLLSVEGTTNTLKMLVSGDGSTALQPVGAMLVCDDRWHFGIGTYDGTEAKLYCDGIIDAFTRFTGGTLFQGAMPFNIGNSGVTAVAGTGNEALPFFGLIDEAFVTGEVLNEDQVRLLMAASIAHNLGVTPVTISASVKRRRRGGPLANANFPSPPRRLYNFTWAGAQQNVDAGADAVNLTANGSVTAASGMNGTTGEAVYLPGAIGNYLSAAGPAAFGAQAKSIGIWFQTLGTGAQMTIIALSGGGATDFRPLYIDVSGRPGTFDGTNILIPSLANYSVLDGAPHLWTVVIDNNAADGLKRKTYVDAQLVASDTNFINPTLGTGSLYIGQLATTEPYKGLLDGLFICDYALTAEQIATIFAVGSKLVPGSIFDSSIVEAADASNLYVIANQIDPQHTVDFRVAA